ncbi:MAG: YqaE/Pmp3 family membrane protein [Sphingomonadales bacterium]
MDMTRILCATLLPPVAIYRERGFDGSFWMNLLLTAGGFFPGVFHSLWIMAEVEDEAVNRIRARNLSTAGS